MTEPAILKHFTTKDTLRLLHLLLETSPQAALEVYHSGRPGVVYIPENLAPDKADWLRRKRNTVLYFGLSTQALFEKQKGEESLLASKYGLELKDYTWTPGGVPIQVKGVGLVGAVTVTGLKPEEDHALALGLLRTLQEEQHHDDDL